MAEMIAHAKTEELEEAKQKLEMQMAARKMEEEERCMRSAPRGKMMTKSINRSSMERGVAFASTPASVAPVAMAPVMAPSQGAQHQHAQPISVDEATDIRDYTQVPHDIDRRFEIIDTD